MKGISSKISRTLVPGAIIVCADNSGARLLKVMSRIGKSGTKNRMPSVGIGDLVMASVKSGNPQYIKKRVRVVIIRQRQPIRRPDGMRLRFEDNAAILVNDANLPIGTEVKGAMAREVVERYIKLASIASRVV
ncbi:MAG: uL14 family ribosomal protein [Candidatus Marsarchaeota archaeon]|jgi:large subunit ribosomal protein L14|nr:uL14 family ribosomal protein [Candidatus Marsarchaeota archaeon]MCL5007249.1 uL14 family ribosomal protein [Candidatus Marsarchaeota archaeon]MCL5430865.1 uL14 family ribosomal protein [Candidatus Marsarchaeota archaeon]